MTKEEREQKQLLQWVRIQYPNLLYTEDLGGVRLPKGLAIKVSKSRCKKGHPDLMFQSLHYRYDALAYVGLAIEFKATGEIIEKKNGELRKHPDHLPHQYDYLMELRKQGWFACFCIGFKEAQKLIKAYMSHNLEDLRALEPFVFPRMK
jgi:hypothetical protein